MSYSNVIYTYQDERAALINAMGNQINNLQDLISKAITKKELWTALEEFANRVMIAKENAERETERDSSLLHTSQA